MPTRKSAEKSDAASDVKEVQAIVDEETEQGYVGTKTDPIPNEEYTLTTGPDSPPTYPDDRTRAAQSHVNDGEG